MPSISIEHKWHPFELDNELKIKPIYQGPKSQKRCLPNTIWSGENGGEPPDAFNK